MLTKDVLVLDQTLQEVVGLQEMCKKAEGKSLMVGTA